MTPADHYERPPRRPTLADALTDGIPPGRVILVPTPGTATPADVVQIIEHEDRLCELVDGVLVERAYGFTEAVFNVDMACALLNFVQGDRLGFVLGAKLPYRLGPRLVRCPDITYIARSSLPDGKLPDEQIATFMPDLVVETWKPGNTPAEMNRKLRDYFAAGVRLVWYVRLRQRAVHVYHAADAGTLLEDSGTLDGGSVLPGFRLKVADLLDSGQYGRRVRRQGH